jgi:serine/threonine-protein kinase
MGVVYQARQATLKRLVALKMILAGPQASPEQLARFHREAEAVARLQHPNIVQIYEIGEQRGQPYLSLEFVDGGSLDKQIAGQPQPEKVAAQLVETLARVMHYAHQKGIIHRDLKPANVLLVRSDRLDAVELGRPNKPEHYEPKITDFGLAKELGGDSSPTQSGAILGTPTTWPPSRQPAEPEKSGRSPTSTPWERSCTKCSPGAHRSGELPPWKRSNK